MTINVTPTPRFEPLLQIANIGPADWNYDETLSTLRYSNRAKNIKNRPKINEDPKDTMLREVQEEIQRLKEQLANRGGGGVGRAASDVCTCFICIHNNISI